MTTERTPQELQEAIKTLAGNDKTYQEDGPERKLDAPIGIKTGFVKKIDPTTKDDFHYEVYFPETNTSVYARLSSILGVFATPKGHFEEAIFIVEEEVEVTLSVIKDTDKWEIINVKNPLKVEPGATVIERDNSTIITKQNTIYLSSGNAGQMINPNLIQQQVERAIMRMLPNNITNRVDDSSSIMSPTSITLQVDSVREVITAGGILLQGIQSSIDVGPGMITIDAKDSIGETAAQIKLEGEEGKETINDEGIKFESDLSTGEITPDDIEFSSQGSSAKLDADGVLLQKGSTNIRVKTNEILLNKGDTTLKVDDEWAYINDERICVEPCGTGGGETTCTLIYTIKA
jgi:hypothetical protein